MEGIGLGRVVLQAVLTASLVLFAPLAWRGCDHAPVPPVPPSPPMPVPPSPAPRPADEHGGRLWDAYQSDGGPTKANTAAKAQLAAVYRMAAQVARDPAVKDGSMLLDRVKQGAKNLLDAEYLSALPTVRKAINGIVSDHLDQDELTPEKRTAAASLFESIAKSLGEF